MELKKVLFVLTSHDVMGNTGRKTGVWIEEFAAPYYTFLDAGKEIVIASPKGGQAPIDPKNKAAFRFAKQVFAFIALMLLIPTLSWAQRLPVNKVGSALPDSISWFPFNAFPAQVRLAVMAGDPATKGPYVVRVKVPAGIKLMPHIHPEDRIYTVMSGVFYIGIGSNFDSAKLMAFPPGAVFILPGNTPHFHWAKSGEYVSQVSATGPLGISYINPADDPRNH